MGVHVPKAWSPDKKKLAGQAEDMAHIKADLCPCSPEQKVMPLGALCQSGTETPQWRWDVLVGEGDPLYCKSREI